MQKYLTIIFLILIGFVLPASPTGLNGSQTAQISGKPAPIILTGQNLPEINGAKIEKVRVFARHGGKWEPIPFQIDKREVWKKRVHYIMPDKMGPVSERVFEGDDELVFMGMDLGEKASPGEPALGQQRIAEIAAVDTATGQSSYAYVMTFETPSGLQGPPPLSAKSYIRWNEKARSVEATGYFVTYPKNDALFFNGLSVPKERGGTGENFVDTLKLRGNSRVIVSLFVYDVNNMDYRNTQTGVIVGPVRVIRKVKAQFNSVMFRVRTDHVYCIYYPEWFSVEIPVKFGVRKTDLLWATDTRLSLDLADSASGMTFINQNNPQGAKIDGTLNDDEKNLKYGPYRWFAFVGAPGKVVVRLDQSQLSEARQDMFYIDDKGHKDPPENYPGQMGDAGFEILNSNNIPNKGRIFKMEFFFPTEWDAAATPNRLMAVVDNPATVKVQEKAIPAAAIPPAIVTETPWKQEAPRASYKPKAISERTRGYLPQILADPNLGYGTGFQVVERKTLGTPLSSDFLFLISNRAYQFYRLEEIYKNFGPISEAKLYIEYIDHPNRYFYGVGNNQAPEDLTVFKQQRFWVYLRMEKYFMEHYMAALQFDTMHNKISHGKLFSGNKPSIEEKFGAPDQIKGFPFGAEVFGMQGGWTNSVRLDLAIDHRDDKLYPRTGFYHILEAQYTPKWLGSDYQYFSYRLDMRFYLGGPGLNPEKTIPRNLWARLFVGAQTERVFAIRLVGQRMEADKLNFAGRQVLDIPFYNESYFGDANSSRGHYWAQWIDRDLTFAMFELRWHMYKIIDATIFYDVGRVWDDVYDIKEWRTSNPSELHSSYGFGMRFNMVPAMMMRIDFGISKENPGGLLYVYAWHTF